MYHLAEAYLMAGYICLLAAYFGALVFGAASIAPLAVTTLPVDQSALLLRRFWPQYHRFAVLGGVFFTLVCAVGSFFSAVPLIYSTVLLAIAGVMTLSFYVGLHLIPAINLARDMNDEPQFKRLHRLDVVLVAVGLLAALALLVGLVYVLPGQFTFWPTVQVVAR
ncbi:MAG: hypothetical protein NXH95_09490 [Pseudomonadaceae bacterium]|nr:hypothetical protein [Pseudomonadaceae bacterium]